MVARKQYVVDLRDGSGRSIKFDAPVNATPTQIGVLAQRALKREAPGQTFQRPRLDRAVAQQAKAFDASASATPDTLRNRTSDKARLMARGVGFSDERANQIADRTSGAADFVPGIGDAIGADDAARAYRRGDYGEAAISALATGVGVLPVFGDAAGAMTKAMFLGAKAKNADLAALAKAKSMVDAGDSKNTIWNETGWFQGADKKWRFEIPDDDLKVKADGWELPQLPRRVRGLRGAGATTEEELGWVRRMGEEDGIENVDQMVARKVGTPRQEAVSHPTLAEAYPATDELAFSRMQGQPSQGGFFRPSENLVAINPDFNEKPRSVMAHELQHFVQEQEGFAQGGMIGTVNNMANSQIGAINKRMSDLAKAMDIAPAATKAELKVEYDALMDQRSKLSPEAQIDPYEGYRRLAGEVEARNVQTRLDMDPETRRAWPPWATQEFPDDEQFKIWGGDGAANLGEPSSLNLPRNPTLEEMQRFSQRQSVSLDAARHGNRLDWGKNKAGQYGEPLVPGFADRPVAVQMENGEFVLLDGNHRAAMARQLGVPDMEMDVIPARLYDPENMGMKPAPSRMSEDDLDALMRELGDDPLSKGW